MGTKVLKLAAIAGAMVLGLAGCKGADASATRCEPGCSPGFFCLSGLCVEDCNPACGEGFTCNSVRVCEAIDSEVDTSVDVPTEDTAPEDTAIDSEVDAVIDVIDDTATDPEPDVAEDVPLDGSDTDVEEWPHEYPEPLCVGDDCETGTCVGGACVEAVTPDDFPRTGAWGTITDIQVNTDEPCCFDLDGNGTIDNQLIDFISAFAATSDSNPIDTARDQFQRGVYGFLVQMIGIGDDTGVDLSLTVGINDTDSDGGPDTTPEERMQGDAVYRMLSNSFGEYGPTLRFPAAEQTDGEIRTTAAPMIAEWPLPQSCSWHWQTEEPFADGSRCRGELPHPFVFDELRIEADVDVVDGGLATRDGDQLGMRMGGYLHVDTILELLNTNYGDNCLCAGIERDEDLLVSTVRGSRLDISCSRTIDEEAVAQCPTGARQCAGIEQLCNVAPVLANFASHDSDGDGVDDSISFGVELTLSPASIDDPAFTSTWEYCADGLDNDGDGLTDCGDPECWDQTGCFDWVYPGEMCHNGLDEDRDGDTDCDDSNCTNNRACTEE